MAISPKVRKLQSQRLLWIGAVCEQWSFLEYLLLYTMAKLLEVETETAKILFGGLDIRPRIMMTIELAKHLKADQELIDQLVRTRDQIDKNLLKRRNRAIHGVHFIYDDGDLQVEVHRGKDRTRRSLTLDELVQLCDDIYETGNNLADAISLAFEGQPRPPYTLLRKPVKRSRKKKPPKRDQTLKPPEPPPQS